MIYIKYDDTGKVNYAHHMPFDVKHGLGKPTEELEREGMLIPHLPAPEIIPGKEGTMYCNPDTGEVWFEYGDISPTPDEIGNQKIEQLETALLEMTTLNAMQQAQNEQAIMELTMMIGGM